jgi:murein DD-endopeptidase MepM/ murein hydrolase activator NlpD
VDHVTRSCAAAALAVVGGLLPTAHPAVAQQAVVVSKVRPGWAWPLDGAPRVVRAFDPPSRRWDAGHRGVDLLARAGVPVRSAGPGAVTFAGPVAGRGVVVVTHADGTRTTYEPVDRDVRVGALVSAGDTLGRLTGAGSHCLPAACLHWGRRRGDLYLDPMLLVRAGPARLFPVWAAGKGRSWPGSARRAPPVPDDPLPAEQDGGRAVAGRWGLTTAGNIAVPAIALGAVLALRRRRAQIRAGSSAASKA